MLTAKIISVNKHRQHKGQRKKEKKTMKSLKMENR